MRRISAFAWLLLVIVANADAASAPKAVPEAHVILLVRHGHYESAEGGDERTTMGLTPLGIAQARLVGARLAGRPGRIDGLHVSPLKRAQETAAVIGESFPGRHFETDEDLAECTPPTRRAEVMAGEKPGDLAACEAQLDRVFARYFVPARGAERTDLLVAHGNVIRYLVTKALGVDTKAWLEMSVGHASLTVIRVEADGRLKVIAVGDVGHLPPNLLTGATGDTPRELVAPALP